MKSKNHPLTTLQKIQLDHEDLIIMDGYDDCIIGICERFGQEPVLIYDKEKVIKTLMKRDKMSREEAIEYHEYNQLGSWVGNRTPAFLTRYN